MPLAANSIGGQRAFPLARRQRVARCVIVAVAITIAVAVAIAIVAIITATATRIFGRRKFLY